MLTRLPSQTHEALYRIEDSAGDLCGLIAIHSEVSGPAIAGLQLSSYADETAAIDDVLALSHAMTCRTTATGLQLGGGAIVIPFEPDCDQTPDRLKVIGKALNALGGRVRAMPAMGASGHIMALLSLETDFVAGLEKANRLAPATLTAQSAFNAIRIGAAHRFGSDDIAGRQAAVQGLGQVGWQICALLHQAGANLVVADPDPVLLTGAVHAFGARMSAPRKILGETADILVPCSIGRILDPPSIARITAGLIAGPASNQLATLADADILHARGVLFLPDCLVSAGGIIQVASELLEVADSAGWIDRKMADVARALQTVLTAARTRDIPPMLLKEEMIRARLMQDMHQT